MSHALQSVLDDLASRRNEGQFKRYTKNGVTAEMYGVLMGQIRKVAAEIKDDPALAQALWGTAILEAQLLATLIVKPAALDLEQVEAMAASTCGEPVTHWFSNYLLRKHSQREHLREPFMASKNVYCRRYGWSLTDQRVCKDAKGLDLDGLLDTIEAKLASEDPLVQWTMNDTLASVGVKHPSLRKRAIAIGEAIGLYSDWPHQAGCTRPYAPEWIAKMVGG